MAWLTESRCAVIFVLVHEKCVSLKKYLNRQSYCGLKHHMQFILDTKQMKLQTFSVITDGVKVVLVGQFYFVQSILCFDLCILVFNLQFGYIVLTTSAGIMDHEEARRKNVGGKVLGFFY